MKNEILFSNGNTHRNTLLSICIQAGLDISVTGKHSSFFLSLAISEELM
jgi:hypothetical protein